MQKLRTFLHIIDLISEWTGKIVSFLIILIIGTTVWWVLLRYIFHTSSAWNYSAATKFFFIYVILGAAYVLRHGAHANMDILHRRLSTRVRSIVDLFISILFFIFCIALLWMAIDGAVRTVPHLDFSFRLFWPLYWPTMLLAPIGVSLLLLQGLAKFIRDLITAITGDEIT